MKSISPGINKYLGILLVLVSILYFSTRLFHLTILPIFNDEANYIFWAKNIAVTNKHWFFILTDGKPPLPHWAMVFFLKLLPTQMFLAAGRLPSVFAGFLSLIGVYFLAVELFDRRRVAFFAAIFYLLCPFILFHDRMALFDAFLNSALIWTVLFFIRACKSNNWADFLAWGFFQGVALLSKPTAIIYWALLPTGYIFLKIARTKAKQLKQHMYHD
jgi:4-amino-4-deoxy-L-arabinose transferase-like glycosyltransferase